MCLYFFVFDFDFFKKVYRCFILIAGFTTGIILGVFLLGIATVRVGSRAAFVGMAAGTCIMSSVYFGTDLAWPWYALVGSSATFMFGLLASLVFPRSAATP